MYPDRIHDFLAPLCNCSVTDQAQPNDMNGNVVQVIGVGAPQGDDWVGWELAERLRDSAALAEWREQVAVTLHDHPQTALLAAWRGGGLVILLDAVRSGVEPGTRHRFDANQLTSGGPAVAGGSAGVLDAVRLAAALEALPESLLFYGIEADPEHRDLCLSPAVEAVLGSVVAEIESAIRSYLTAIPNHC
jgi:hydrogenase maturation protease